MPTLPVTVYNENMDFLYWSKSTTTKGLIHTKIRENAIREAVHEKTIHVKHIRFETNLADIFTKDHKDNHYFLTICDQIAPKYLPIMTL